jgi:hypothetical protein
VHFLHNLIAAIDTGGTSDALILQAIADIDAGRADLYTDAAIDTIAQALLSRLQRARAPATRLNIVRKRGPLGEKHSTHAPRSARRGSSPNARTAAVKAASASSSSKMPSEVTGKKFIPGEPMK